MADSSAKLDRFLMSAWGRCPAYNVDMNLPLSRVCPLALEVYQLRNDSQGLLSFACAEHRRRTCPLAGEVADLALAEAESDACPPSQPPR